MIAASAVFAGLAAPAGNVGVADEDGYTIEMDFEIETVSAGVIFAASSTSTYYMWQFNNENPSNPRLRPHRWTDGNPALLDEIDLAPLGISLSDSGEHHLRIDVSGGVNADTYIDGVLVDSRSGDFRSGYLGFRQSFANGVPEVAYYDDISVTKKDGTVVFTADFTEDRDFSFGEVVDGRYRVPGKIDGENRSWSRDFSGTRPHFALEADMTLVKDDVAFIFSHLDDANYYMWAVNGFDYDQMCIRHHVFDNGNLRWDDSKFTEFSKDDIIGAQHHVKFEVRDAMIYTFIDDVMVDKYLDYSSKLVPAAVGVRIDTTDKQDDDAYIDNIKVTEYAADGSEEVKLLETFEPGSPRWFPNVITEEIDGNTMMHIFGDRVLYKWMQADEPVYEAVEEGYILTMDFEIEQLNVGVCFSATSHENYYMWQINNENPDAPKFRPHVWSGGVPRLLGEYDIPAEVDLNGGGVHKLRINVTNYLHADTYIDDVLIDSRDGAFPVGMVGIRETHSDDAGTYESAYFDNVILTSLSDGSVLLKADFNDENEFSSGDVVDGRLYVAGRMDWDHFAWSRIPGNNVWFKFEADMTLVKDDVAFIFSHLDDDNYYMWAVNCFDEPGNIYPRVRRHVFNPGLWWNDNVFNQYTKDEILGVEHHVTIEVRGGYVCTYINDDLVDRYFDMSPKLVPGFVGVRIDTTAEQCDDAYIDNIKVTVYDADGVGDEVLFDDFEPDSPRWFQSAVVESVDGNHKMHISGDKVLHKWMQSESPVTTGVGSVSVNGAECEGEVEYYNVQGMRLGGPVKGLYIERRGGVSSKRVGR